MQQQPFTLAFSHACDGGVACVTTASKSATTTASRFAVGTHSAHVCLVTLHKAYSRVAELQGPAAGSSALCFTPDGTALYAGGADGSLMAFALDTDSGGAGAGDQPVLELRGDQLLAPEPDQPNSPVAAMCPQPGPGSCVVVACGRLIKVVDLASGKLLDKLGPLASEVLQVGWLGPDWLFAGHAAGHTVWHRDPAAATTGKPRWRQQLQHNAADALYSRFAVAPNKIVAATCSNKKEVHVWRFDQWLDTPDQAAPSDPVVMDEYDSEVQNLAWDPQGRFLATSDGGTATVWDFEGTSDRPAHSIICGGHDQGSQITCLSFNSAGTFMLSAGDDAKLVFFNGGSFSPGGIAQAMQSVALGIPPQRLTSALWLDDDTVGVAAAGGTLLCLRVCAEQLADPSAAGATCQLNGVPELMQKLAELNVSSEEPAEVTTPSPGAEAPISATLGKPLPVPQALPEEQPHAATAAGSSSAPPAQTPSRGAANGVSSEASQPPARVPTPTQHSASPQGGGPSRVRTDRQPLPETPQRRREVSRGAGPGARGRNGNGGRVGGGYQERTFTSGVMRPYSSTHTGRSSSPARSTSSSKDSNATGMAGMGARGWMVGPGGAAGPGWGHMAQLPAGMAFHQLPFPPHVAGMSPAVLGPQGMVPFYLPRGPIQGGAPAGMVMTPVSGPPPQGGASSAASPKGAPPLTAFLMPGAMAYPGGPVGYQLGMYPPPQQQQQLRQIMAMQQAQAQFLASQHAAMIGTGAGGAADGIAASPAGVLEEVPAGEPSTSSHAPENAVATLYVGNLAPSVDEYVLQTTFMYFGAVSNVQVIRDKTTSASRGFGFVTFMYAQSATEAMRQMNGKAMYGPYEGRQVKVAPSSRLR